MATIARMHVELIARGDRYRRDIEKSRTTTQKLRHELTKTRSAFGLIAGGTGAALAAKKVFELGSAAEETASKFSTVFGQSTDEVQRFIDNFATIAGLSQTQAREVTATTGAIVQGMGFAQEASARFSQEVVKLAGDLSSFNNIPIEETSLAIQAALTGEREQLKRLGIVLREADVQQRALAMSGKASAEALTDQERATASLQLITERAGVAVGDLARTQDSAANEARALKAEIENVKESIAVSLLPGMSVGVTALNSFIKGLQIMGAEAAVSVAKVELAFAKMNERGGFKGFAANVLGLGPGAGVLDPFGLDMLSRFVGADLTRTVEQAEANLRSMEDAAEAVTLDIVGLAGALTGGGGGGGGAGGVVGALRDLNVTAATFASQLPTITTRVKTFRLNTDGAASSLQLMMTPTQIMTAFMNQYALALQKANEQLREQNRLQQQFGAVLGALGFISGLPGLGFLSGPLGKISGGVSSFFGLRSAFEERAHGGPVSGGTAYTVGERGPELFVPSQSGTIIPNGGISLNVSMSKPRGPREAARDSEWLRELAFSLRELEGNGFRAATS